MDPASQRRSVAASQRRSPNSVAASLQRCSVAAPTASQRQQRRSAAPASQRRSVNSVAATAALQRRSVAASQRHSVAGPWQRRSVAAPPAPQSVAASQRHPPPGASQHNVGNPRFGPLCPRLVLRLAPCVFGTFQEICMPFKRVVFFLYCFTSTSRFHLLSDVPCSSCCTLVSPVPRPSALC